MPGAASRTARGRGVLGCSSAAASAAGVGSNVRGAAALGFAGRRGLGFAAVLGFAAASAAGVASNVRGAAAFGFTALFPAAVRAAADFAVAVAARFAAGVALCFARVRAVGAPGTGMAAVARAASPVVRRLPIRSGRAVESEPRTPGSSFFAFGFCFLGLSAMSPRV